MDTPNTYHLQHWAKEKIKASYRHVAMFMTIFNQSQTTIVEWIDSNNPRLMEPLCIFYLEAALQCDRQTFVEQDTQEDPDTEASRQEAEFMNATAKS